MRIENLPTPAFLVEEDKLNANIQNIQRQCTEKNTQLWPMTKTHKSLAIAHMQQKAGAAGFLTGTLKEAEKLAGAGIQNIAYAYPIAGKANLRRAIEIARKTCFFYSVDSPETIRLLAQMYEKEDTKARVLVIINSGLGRFGVLPKKAGELAAQIAQEKNLLFAGISTHPGHVYAAAGKEQLAACIEQEAQAMRQAVQNIRLAGQQCRQVASGNTPALQLSLQNPQITVQRPGNYVFYDRVQHFLGACRLQECALTVLATVVSNPAAGRYIIDAGSKALGLDKGAHSVAGIEGYGCIAALPEAVVTSLSEEVGILHIPPAAGVQIGDTLQIIPNHACSAANLANALTTHKNGVVTGQIEIDMRR